MRTGARRALPLGLVLLAASWGGRAAEAGEVVESFEDGTPRLRYVVDDEGRKQGPFVEYYRSGKPAVKATYRQDRLDGLWTAFFENGRTRAKGTYRAGSREGKWEEAAEDGSPALVAHFADGVRHGSVVAFRGRERRVEQQWERGELVLLDGEPAFPVAREALAARLRAVLPAAPPVEAPYDLARDRENALTRLKAFRCLCGVPYADLVADSSYAEYAQAASRVCAAIGELTHEPPNPGWPAAEYAVAAKGAGNCNLSRDGSALASVDGYMDDSDPTNIDRLGHRCWCLSPGMARTGFGFVRRADDKTFSAMWARDVSRTPPPAVEVVCFPTRGWMPIELFGPAYAWSVALSEERWRQVDPARVTVTVERLDADFLPAGAPLALEAKRTVKGAPGLGWLVIFRPTALTIEDGAAFRVVIDGLGPPPASRKSLPTPPIRYLVRFTKLLDAPGR